MKNARPSAFRLRRAYLGLSLRDVAAELGVSHDTVWRIERGERPVQPEEREKLARILGLSPTETLTLFQIRMTTKRALPPSAKSGEGEVRPDGLVSVSEILRQVERDRYLSPAETAEYLSISERSLRYLGIPRYRVGRLVRYRKSEVDSWMEKHRERPDELGALVDGALEGLQTREPGP